MIEWDKLKAEYKQPPLGMTRTKILGRVWAEGDKLKDRVEYLEGLTDGNGEMLKAKLVEVQKLEQKLEAIQKIAEEYNNLLSDPEYMINRILGVLGE